MDRPGLAVHRTIVVVDVEGFGDRRRTSAHQVAVRIRLRMALHAGEVTYDRRGVTAAAVNLAFRLLDAAVVKTALAESPGVLAVITSGWFYDEVVRHSPFSDAATYRPVHATAKETATVAWISLPDHPYPPAAPHRFSASGSFPGSFPAEPFDELPRQLPLAIRDFTGRAEHLAALDALVSNDQTHAVVISAIDGTAGVGKTALAVHWAHRVQHRFPDGTLYVNLRGYGPGQPATPAEVLDNANAAQQVRPLIPGSPGCLVLITSRSSLTGLVVNEAATRLTLDLLTSTEALDLVRGILGADRVAAEPQAVTELIRICARLPLALRIAASHTQYSIADVVAEMNGDRGRLDALSTLGNDPAAVRAVFDWSYQRLNTNQARLFRRLGLHPGPEISLHAAAAVAELDPPETRRLLDTLTDAHLLEPVARDRYQLHDLLRAYAAERAEYEDFAEVRDHARRALAEWYAHHSSATFLAVFPALADWHPLLTLHTGAHPPITCAGRTDAWRWLETEQANLIACAHYAADHNLLELAILIGYTALTVPVYRGEWNAVLDLAEVGLAVARRIGDRCSEYPVLLRLADMHHSVGQWTKAFATRQDALALAQSLGDPWLEAGALGDLGLCSLYQGRYAEAIDYFQPALLLSQGAQRGRLEGSIEINLGAAHVGLGNYQQAISHAGRGLTLRRQAGDQEGEAYGLWQIARARQGMGMHSEVVALCERALTVKPDYLYPPITAAILDTWGTSLQQTGDIERAVACWREALEIFDRFGDPRAAELRARLDTLGK